ncbi:MAG: single-stranded DNA-binding protein [Saprospiraceae bacterium]
MSSVTNKVQLMGHLGQEPMVKQFATGSKMASFSLATNESYISASGTKIENTQWHRLVAWGEAADKVESQLTKGAKIALTGKISNRTYEAKDGTKKYATEIVVQEFDVIKTEKALTAA